MNDDAPMPALPAHDVRKTDKTKADAGDLLHPLYASEQGV